MANYNPAKVDTSERFEVYRLRGCTPCKGNGCEYHDTDKCKKDYLYVPKPAPDSSRDSKKSGVEEKATTLV